jgi:hypothetical protein
MRPPRQAKLTCVLALSVVSAFIGPTAATASPPPANKVTICHHTHGKDGTHWITITVAASAVPAHVRNHGDIPGPCPSLPKASTNGDATPSPSAQGKANPPSSDKASGSKNKKPSTPVTPTRDSTGSAPAPLTTDGSANHDGGSAQGTGDGAQGKDTTSDASGNDKSNNGNGNAGGDAPPAKSDGGKPHK